MASFTDQISTFNPYIQQIPVDDYARVGMEKQRQYDEGVQRVQSYIDSVAGIDVVKGEHKDYLDQRVKQLSTEISKTLSEDFSNKQLLGQIGTLATQVVKDPIVQNAVLSTQKYRGEIAKMEKAKAEGKSGPANEWLLQKQANIWLNDGDAKSGFNGEYIQYVDYSKKVMEAIKAVDSSSKLSQLPFLRDEMGNPKIGADGKPSVDVAMLELHYEGKSLDAIRNAIQGALSEADLRQLQMDGMYHYRGETPQTLKKTLDTNYQSRLDQINTRRQLINLKRAESVGDKDALVKLNQESAQVEDEADNLVNDYKQDFETLNTNPEGFKSRFFVTHYVNTLSSAYSTMKEEIKYLKNPYMDQMNEDRRYNLDLLKLQAEVEKNKLDAQAKKDKEDKDKPKAAPGELPFPLPPDVQKPTEQLFLEDIQLEEQTFKQIEGQAMNALPNSKDLTTEQKRAAVQALFQSYERTGNFSGDPVLKQYFESMQGVKQQWDNKKAILSEVMSEADKNYAITAPPIRMGSTQYTPQEVSKFVDKFQNMTSMSPIGEGAFEATVNEAKLAQLSPKEKELFKIAFKNMKGQSLSKGEKTVADALSQHLAMQRGRGKDSPVFEQRNSFISERLGQRMPGIYQPRGGNFSLGTPEARRLMEQTVGDFILRAETEGGGMEKTAKFDIGVSRKILSKPETIFSYVKTGNEVNIVMQSPGEDTQYIPVKRSEYEGKFQESLWSPTQFIDDAIVQSGESKSTNVLGKGAETALFGKKYFPGVQKVGVKADLRQAPNGGYAVDLHIFDAATKRWSTVPYPVLAETGQKALDAFKVLTDEDLLNLIK